MADPKARPEAALAKTKSEAPAEAEAPTKEGPLRWMVGWLLVPALVIGGIFGAGVLVGVHLSDSWYTRLVVWVVGLFG